MSGKLGYSTVARRNCIAWYEDGEEGAIVGQEDKKNVAQLLLSLAKAHPDVRDYWTVEVAAKRWLLADGERYEATQEPYGITVGTTVGVRKLMAACKGALKLMQASTDHWPDWAKTAVENGWKPPKGWQP